MLMQMSGGGNRRVYHYVMCKFLSSKLEHTAASESGAVLDS